MTARPPPSAILPFQALHLASSGPCPSSNALPTPPKGRPYPAQVQKSVNPPTTCLFKLLCLSTWLLQVRVLRRCRPVPSRAWPGQHQREGPALHRRRTRRPAHPEPASPSSRGSPPGFFPSVSSFDAAWSPVCAWPGRHGGKCRIALPTSTKGRSYPAQASNLANPAHPEPAFSASCPAWADRMPRSPESWPARTGKGTAWNEKNDREV